MPIILKLPHWVFNGLNEFFYTNYQIFDYIFLFMLADGKQLAEITKLIESGIIKPIVDKIFPFAETNEALKFVESGRTKGKVVVKLK